MHGQGKAREASEGERACEQGGLLGLQWSHPFGCLRPVKQSLLRRTLGGGCMHPCIV